MQPLAVHHVSINVGDVEEAVAFYTGTLGLALRRDRPDDLRVEGAWLDAGAQQVHLIRGETAAAKGAHFALLVADLEAVVAELRSGGLTVSDATVVGRSRQAFLRDPDGNLVELHQAG